MRVMVLVPASEESEAGQMPTADGLAEMGKFNEELINAGVLLDGDGLKPTSEAARVKFTDGKTTVIDGPFTESKELVAGFWIWEVKSLDEAIEWIKRAPFGGDTQIELRPFHDPADFGEEYSDTTLRERVAKRREQAASN